ncbi:hypothetical protein AALO_G00104650 [Alosa alosa]|uniref:Secreted protein n=1 Tax=Alosa alosa TaxID=278164 RepID=A0AAV6GV15_9TELE|nr:hypothetical protein AALO_G00104650 [Alosa alosa]
MAITGPQRFPTLVLSLLLSLPLCVSLPPSLSLSPSVSLFPRPIDVFTRVGQCVKQLPFPHILHCGPELVCVCLREFPMTAVCREQVCVCVCSVFTSAPWLRRGRRTIMLLVMSE